MSHNVGTVWNSVIKEQELDFFQISDRLPIYMTDLNGTASGSNRATLQQYLRSTWAVQSCIL